MRKEELAGPDVFVVHDFFDERECAEYMALSESAGYDDAPITTAGGLTFVAGTDDGRFRAYNTRTGRELWTFKLPASAHTNPVTYGVQGRQYVALVSTGGHCRM